MSMGSIIVAVDAGTIIAAIIPSALFIFLILYYTVLKGGGYVPIVIKTQIPLQVVGISTKTTNETFVEDDFLLWKEFRRIKDKNLMFKKSGAGFSFILIKMMPKKDETSWGYLIGEIVPDFDDVPKGFETAEFPCQSYVMIRRVFKRQIPWIEASQKIEKHLYENWIPDSDYEVNPDSPVKTIEYHNKKTESKKRTIIYYIAVRKKKIEHPSFTT